MKLASIINQVNQSVREIDRIGVSKKQLRSEKIKAIHSHKTKHEVLKISKQFANFVRDEHGIRNLYQIKEEHYVSFLDSKNDTTLDYRRGIETHLRLLQEGLNSRAERFGKPSTHFCTEKRVIESKGRLEAVSNRSYTGDEVNAIESHVSRSVSVSVSLMNNLGFRVSESVRLCVKHVQGSYIRIKDDTVTKGGRDRVIPIPEGYQKELNGFMRSLGPDDRIVQVSAGTVMNAVTAACKQLGIKSNGTHGFRHAYARNRINDLMLDEEKKLFTSCMENYAAGKQFDYAVRDRELYNNMKAKMDIVHAELGHGKDRFDLALRYMK